MSRMWLLRRMKLLKLDNFLILDVYMKEIRSLAEQGVPIWHSGLTQNQTRDLEKIQKVALRIISSDAYTNYEDACNHFKLKTLLQRRVQLCTNFAIKLYKSDRSSEFFTHKQPRANSRTDQQLVVENFSRTKRSYNAPHNFLARLINQNISKIKK